MNVRRVHIIAAAIVLLAGCRIHEVQKPISESVSLKESFQGPSGANPKAPDTWWVVYDDPALNQLVEAALTENLQLSQAWARLAQAGALSEQAKAASMPTVGAEVGASRSRSPSPFGSNQESNQFSGTVSVGYEVDLWGGVRDMQDAALLDVRATRLDIEAMAMSLVAQVTEAYFDVIEQNRQLTLLDEQIQVSKDYLSLVEYRFGQGNAAALDVLQQRQSLAGLESRRPGAQTAKTLASHRLAVLLGEMPGAPLSVGNTLPLSPELPNTGLPGDLLNRRPDLKAAELRVMASDHRVGAALANQLPGLRVGADVGTRAPEVDELVSDFVWSIFASVGATIWDGGRLEAEVDRSKAVVKERVEAYRASLLQCVQEVEDALVQNHFHADYLASLNQQKELASSTLAEARSRYLNGLSSYLPVLQALQGLQEIERTSLSAHRRELSYRTSLFRALGGTWFGTLENPHLPQEKEEEENP